MIIIVVIDKLRAFAGPFPIELSEKLFSSGAPADAGGSLLFLALAWDDS